MGVLETIDIAGYCLSCATQLHVIAVQKKSYGVGFSSSSQAFLATSGLNSGGKKVHLGFRPSHRLVSPICRNASEDGKLSAADEAVAGLDRRQLLLASTLGVSALPFINSGQALAAPVKFPDIDKCENVQPANGVPAVNCCLPSDKQIIDFKFPTGPVRLRRAAHRLSPGYIDKYNLAYQLMKALPVDDPRQFMQQAHVHCAFCEGAYKDGDNKNQYQVHESWLFFPWHRWYLYFHERILGKLLNDSSFRLAFWNWDAEAGSKFPGMFIKPDNLHNDNRNGGHMPPVIVDLNFNSIDSGFTPDEQLAYNKFTMYRSMVTSSKTPSLFLGQPYKQGDAPSPGAGVMEIGPHNCVHTWTGKPSNPNDEDMGALYSAGRDPVFYAHHSNVDRMWDIWPTLGGRRRNFTDPDWLDASFLFYDENADLVRVTVRDSLDSRKLGYAYEEVDTPWLKFPLPGKPRPPRPGPPGKPTGPRPPPPPRPGPGGPPPRPMSTGPAGSPTAAYAAAVEEEIKEFKERESKKLEEVIKAKVKRPKKVKADDEEEEILLIEGVEMPADEKVKFDVYINLPEANETTSTAMSEYAGSFFSIPHKHKHEGESKKISNFRLGIGEVLRELDLEEAENFVVTIVPRVKPGTPVHIKDIKLEYE